jgi:hypothetical protein
MVGWEIPFQIGVGDATAPGRTTFGPVQPQDQTNVGQRASCAAACIRNPFGELLIGAHGRVWRAMRKARQRPRLSQRGVS